MRTSQEKNWGFPQKVTKRGKGETAKGGDSGGASKIPSLETRREVPGEENRKNVEGVVTKLNLSEIKE